MSQSIQYYGNRIEEHFSALLCCFDNLSLYLFIIVATSSQDGTSLSELIFLMGIVTFKMI